MSLTRAVRAYSYDDRDVACMCSTRDEFADQIGYSLDAPEAILSLDVVVVGFDEECTYCQQVIYFRGE